jgi:hypothetical protein
MPPLLPLITAYENYALPQRADAEKITCRGAAALTGRFLKLLKTDDLTGSGPSCTAIAIHRAE